MWRFFFLFFLSSSLFAAPPSPERQQELANLLKHDCGACHGMTLKGGLGSSLLAEDLKDKSDDFLITTILEGRKGTAMPPWKKFLTEDDARWLVKQLR
ncbi:MAG: cytochrome c [Methylococcaceae bacterium]|nr:cytochrome c [Methylococcaceae bacterium]